MKRIVCSLVVLAVLSLISGLLSPAFPQQKYAVLISAGDTTLDDAYLNSEYWYDLFLMYRAVIDAGFSHNDIYVLYGDGDDYASAHANYQTATFFPGVAQITDYQNRKSDVADIFSWLANGNATEGIPKVQDGDFLFYWWMGHGETEPGMPDCEYRASIENTGEYVYDHEFDAYLAQLPACVVRVMYVMTCHSAGLIDDLEGLHTMIHTAAPCDLGAASDEYDVVHAELSYHAACAFREQEPGGAAVASDTDGDGVVSCDETNDYTHTNTIHSVTQIGDYRCTAPLIFIDNAQPAADVLTAGVYSRDYAEDDGTEPSDVSQVWFEGPDLWVRHHQDGNTSPQNPEFGQPNYVYARIHNTGCKMLNADVDLSWCPVTAWSNPALWNTFASFTENNLTGGETRVVNREWNTVPAPGKYCLHTVLNAPGDPANADGRAYMDNNKVQINVTVDNVVWGWQRNLHWLLENGLDEATKVDVVVERLDVDPGVELRLKIPRDLEFDRVIGGELTTTREDAEGVVVSHAPRLVLQNVRLGPGAKEEAVLSVRLPRGTKLGRTMRVKVSERLRGREVGGIVFRLTTVDEATFTADLFRQLRNFSDEMGKRFEIGAATDMARVFERARGDLCREDPKALSETVASLSKLQAAVGKELGARMEAEAFARFDEHMSRAWEAARESDWAAFAEHAEEGMMATRPLFLARATK